MLVAVTLALPCPGPPLIAGHVPFFISSSLSCMCGRTRLSISRRFITPRRIQNRIVTLHIRNGVHFDPRFTCVHASLGATCYLPLVIRPHASPPLDIPSLLEVRADDRLVTSRSSARDGGIGIPGVAEHAGRRATKEAAVKMFGATRSAETILYVPLNGRSYNHGYREVCPGIHLDVLHPHKPHAGYTEKDLLLEVGKVRSLA